MLIDNKPYQVITRLLQCFLVACSALGAISCGTLAKKENTGVVIARRAQIRSSTAVVAAEMLEVERGDQVEILDSTTAENGERWMRVSARDIDRTEGWIEARNVMPQALLDLSRKIADEDKEIPSQATGQLRASTNLRVTPSRSADDSILMKLDSGSTFDIIGWKRVPKPRSEDRAEADDSPKAGTTTTTQSARRKAGAKTPDVPVEEIELWYKVRLSPNDSPAPVGWIYGKQVELTVPSDIIFYRAAREFVAWQSLDEEASGSGGGGGDAGASSLSTKDAGRMSRPRSWVILEKANFSDSKPDDTDFDRIFVLGFNKDKQEHYTAYRSPDLDGRLPLRIQADGNQKLFVVNIQDKDGQIKEAKYRTFINREGILKVEPPDEDKNRKKR